MSRSAARIAKAGESAIRAVHRLARTESQETAKESKRENKRKILLGCALIEMMRKDSTLCLRVESFMKEFLERKNDIRAFELTEPVNYFTQLGHQTFQSDAPMLEEARISRTSDATQPAVDASSSHARLGDRLSSGSIERSPSHEATAALHSTPPATAKASS